MANVWVVIKGNSHYVFTEKSDADSFGYDMVIAALLDPPIVQTYKVTAHMYSSIHWEVTLYGKADASKANGWAKHGDSHGVVAYHWHVQATSKQEAIEKAKQLFRDSI